MSIKNCIFVRNNRGNIIKLEIDRILCIEGVKDQTVIIYDVGMEDSLKIMTPWKTSNTRNTIGHTFRRLSKMLPNLVRVHRCYAVNLTRVKYIDKDEIIMEGGHSISMSDGFKKEFYNVINKL